MGRQKLIIAASTEADMRYASGLNIPDPFILIDTGKKRYALLSSLEYGRAEKEAKKIPKLTPVLYNPYAKKVKGRITLAAIAAAFLKEKKIKQVAISPTMWIAHVETLRKAGIKVDIKELYPERVIKSTEEVKEIVKVRNVTVKAMRHCINIIKKSSVKKDVLIHQGKPLTSELLKYEARRICLEQDCDATEIIISHGKQTAYPHDQGSGIIKKGEPIILDFFPRSATSGYWFDMTRTVCKGKAPEKLKKLWNAVKKAQDTSLKKVKAGAKTSDVHNEAERVFKELGYKTTNEEGFIHSTGHGVGLEIHESPSLGRKGEERLKKGMIITVEPGLYYRRGGGARLENTILVTTTGYKELTQMERVLEL